MLHVNQIKHPASKDNQHTRMYEQNFLIDAHPETKAWHCHWLFKAEDTPGAAGRRARFEGMPGAPWIPRRPVVPCSSFPLLDAQLHDDAAPPKAHRRAQYDARVPSEVGFNCVTMMLGTHVAVAAAAAAAKRS